MSDFKGPNTAKLYRVELFTDKVCSEIRCLVPVDVAGFERLDEPRQFYSSVTVTLNNIPNEVRFQVPGATLAEACANFTTAGEAAGALYIERVKQARLQPRIVVPGASPQH